MDSSVSGKDEFWFLRVCHHVPHELYHHVFRVRQSEHTLLELLDPVDEDTTVLQIITDCLPVGTV